MSQYHFDFDVPESQYQRRLRALHWLIAQSEFKFFEYKSDEYQSEQVVSIIETDRPVPEPACPPSGQVLAVSEETIVCWYRPYSEPGSSRFSSWNVDGLFSLMTGVVWPRFLGGRRVSRFLEDEELPYEFQTIARQHVEIQTELARLTRQDILLYLRGKELHTKAFVAIHESDIPALAELQRNGALAGIGISHEDMEYALPRLRSDVKKREKIAKNFLTQRILLELARLGWQSGRLDGLPVSHERKELQEREESSYKEATSVSKDFYAAEFLEFATSDTLQRMEKDLFRASQSVLSPADEYLPRIRLWVAEAYARA